MSNKFSPRERFLIVLSTFLLCTVLFGGRSLPIGWAKEGFKQEIFKELKVFTDVLAIVQRDYVREVESKPLVEGAIEGLLQKLDPHSGYLDPDFYKDLQVQTRGEFGGLGIEITIKDGLLVVVAPMEGSPAAKAGVLPGDSIIKIEGKFTKEFSLVDAVKKLRGPKGSPIEISVARKGVSELIDITIIRDHIMVKSVKKRFLGDGFGYVRISQFMEKTGDDLKSALEHLSKENGDKELRGLIIDVRNNPGGLLTQAIRVSDMFLKEGVVVYTEGRVASQRQKFYAHTRGTEPEYPIIVIVNGGSASASEILAGAMKDHGRALVLGSRTFGKGSVQTITPLENGGALTLTTALYYTKSGRSLQALGVEPDIVISPKKEEEKEPARIKLDIRESDLPGAIQNPDDKKPNESNDAMKQINKTPSPGVDFNKLDVETTDIQEWLKLDDHMSRALDLLKTFNVFKVTSAEDGAMKIEKKGEEEPVK